MICTLRQKLGATKGNKMKERLTTTTIPKIKDYVFKNVSKPESVLSKKQHSIFYHATREAVASEVVRIAKEGTFTNLADLFTKKLHKPRHTVLLDKSMY